MRRTFYSDAIFLLYSRVRVSVAAKQLIARTSLMFAT